MRVLVIGATGYVASRVVPALLERGHEVVAGARNLAKLDAFWWRDRVDVVRMDVLDEESAHSALACRPDAALYLVHGMAGDDFEQADRTAAHAVRRACDAADVARVVYLSGIIPDVPDADLSAHLRSRREVERILEGSAASTITLRAAMLVGAGSTSFELMYQLARRLPVTVIPRWMHSAVEPLAVTDLCRAIVGALERPGAAARYDIGGGLRISYPDLIERTLGIAGADRPAVTVPALPEPLVARIAGAISDLPAPTVSALVESLEHDMVARDDSWIQDLVGEGFTPVALDEAIGRSLTGPDHAVRPSRRDPLAFLPGDVITRHADA